MAANDRFLLLPDTLARRRPSVLNAPSFLADHDGCCFFAGLDDPVMTGPTMTHVNDFRAILIR